jgi:cellobiose-specific phosphotransferase system component IIC
VGAAALQGLYKTPVYDLFINGWGLGQTGETLADAVTMLVNALISCAVYFPIFKLIFRQEKSDPEREVLVLAS